MIDRFYSAAYPIGPRHLSKIAMIPCSGDRDQYAGARFSYDGDFLGYLHSQDMGFITVAGGVTADKLEEARTLGASL